MRTPPQTATSSRRPILALAIALSVITLAGAIADPVATPPKPKNVLTPDAALERLVKGNRRYVEGLSRRQDFAVDRAALVGGQNPYAAILGCADSRVAPELAFDTGRGDLFVVRLAGNFANKDAIASFEYGVAVLGTPLIVVLGHTSCGAVSSTIRAVKDGATFPGHIPSLIHNISPAVKAAQKEQGDLLTNSTRENVLLNVENLKHDSPILERAVKEGRLKIVGGIYHLDTGKVELL